MNKQIDGPIIICGFGRSGTTLAANILGSHSEVAIPYKHIRLWDALYKKYGSGNFSNKTEKLYFLGEALEYFRHGYLDFQDRHILNIVDKILSDNHLSFKDMLEAIFVEYLEKTGKKIWGIKEPIAVNYINIILDIFPKAKILHLVRDPSRILTSWKREQKGDEYIFSPITVCKIKKAFQDGIKNQKRFPQQYMLIKYEDLVTEPEKNTKSICDFIGVAYEGNMLQMKGNKWKGHDSGFSDMGGVTTISKVPLKRPGKLSNFELFYCKQKLGREMIQFGYTIEHNALRPHDFLLLIKIKIIFIIDTLKPYVSKVFRKFNLQLPFAEKWRSIKRRWGVL